jgi:hypothetical protein
MQYYSDELFDHVGESLGWFVFYPNGDIFSADDSEAQADNVVSSLNRGEDLQPPAAGEAHATYELFDADGSIGSASFDASGNFIPGTYRKVSSLDAKASGPRKKW